MIAKTINYFRVLVRRLYSKFHKPKKEIPVINMSNFKILDFDSIVFSQLNTNEALPYLGRLHMEIPIEIKFFKMPKLKTSNQRRRARFKAWKLIKRGHDKYVKQAFSI